MMDIDSFDDLLQAAQQQPEPQRLLFVFVAAQDVNGVPDDNSGTLDPIMYVDKLPSELSHFSDLAAESRLTGQAWDLVFVAGLSGRAGIAPNSDEAEQPLKMMVESIKGGAIGRLLAFNKDGEPVAVSARPDVSVN